MKEYRATRAGQTRILLSCNHFLNDLHYVVLVISHSQAFDRHRFNLNGGFQRDLHPLSLTRQSKIYHLLL